MGNKEWLEAMKPGDQVIVKGGSAWGHKFVHTVEKITATQIVVNGVRYARKTGWQRGGGTYDKRYLIEPTPTMMEEITRKALHERVKLFCNSKRAAEISLADLQAVVQLLDG